MKVELNLTQNQLEFLKDILYSKYVELDTKQNNLLICRDFNIDQSEFQHYDQLIEQLEKPLFDVDFLLHQLNNNVCND